MIVLDVCLDNFYAFKNFHMNLTYPKKIVGSYIDEEHLAGYSNFRYKKVNIFFGANASGKTTFGKILMKIFNFLVDKNYSYLTDAICDSNKDASFLLDLASDDGTFYHVKCIITPCTAEKYSIDNIKIQIQKEKIGKRDSYETCLKKLNQNDFFPAENYIEELEKISGLAWLFEYPEDDKRVLNLPNKDENFRKILENVVKALDPSIRDVTISKDVDNAYVVHLLDKAIVLQNGEKLDTDILSSGTKAGVKVAMVLSSLVKGTNRFYYCDEKFSYIHSDVEKAILSLMIDYLGHNDQLFFTTHNTDVLDMNLPKHSFTFLRKDVTDSKYPITCIDASSLLKRSTDSLRNAVENDLFSTAPALELIYDIADFQDER